MQLIGDDAIEQRLVEAFRRDSNWRPEYYREDDDIPSTLANVDMPLAAVYQDLE